MLRATFAERIFHYHARRMVLAHTGHCKVVLRDSLPGHSAGKEFTDSGSLSSCLQFALHSRIQVRLAAELERTGENPIAVRAKDGRHLP